MHNYATAQPQVATSCNQLQPVVQLQLLIMKTQQLQLQSPVATSWAQLGCSFLQLLQLDLKTLIMQWMPEYHNFVLDHGILTGIGKVHPIQCYKMQQLCIALQQRAAQSDFSKELLVSQLTVILENLLHRLEFISMDFCRMQLTVCETQRIFLELTALLNYHNYFHPILSLTQPPTPTQIHLPLQKSWGPLLQILQCAISFPGWHPSLAREAKLSALYNLHEGACTYHLGTRR